MEGQCTRPPAHQNKLQLQDTMEESHMNENNWTPDPENITEPVSDSAASFQETDSA